MDAELRMELSLGPAVTVSTRGVSSLEICRSYGMNLLSQLLCIVPPGFRTNYTSPGGSLPSVCLHGLGDSYLQTPISFGHDMFCWGAITYHPKGNYIGVCRYNECLPSEFRDFCGMVTISQNKDSIRVLFYSYYTTITGEGSS